MAALAKSGVTVLKTWYSGWNKHLSSRRCTVVLSSMGTVANPIPASALGFSKFEGPVHLTIADNSIVLVGVPSADQSVLLLKAAGSNAPADFSGTFTGTFTGYAA